MGSSSWNKDYLFIYFIYTIKVYRGKYSETSDYVTENASSKDSWNCSLLKPYPVNY